MIQNRLKLILFQIAIKQENPDAVKTLTNELAKVCGVELISVRRWLLNDNQPNHLNVSLIMTHLSKYDETLQITDFYKSAPVANVTPSKQLVK